MPDKGGLAQELQADEVSRIVYGPRLGFIAGLSRELARLVFYGNLFHRRERCQDDSILETYGVELSRSEYERLLHFLNEDHASQENGSRSHR
jgi:hypothetical protein